MEMFTEREKNIIVAKLQNSPFNSEMFSSQTKLLLFTESEEEPNIIHTATKIKSRSEPHHNITLVKIH